MLIICKDIENLHKKRNSSPMDIFLLIHYFDITSMINLVGDIKEKAPFLAKNYVNKFVCATLTPSIELNNVDGISVKLAIE